MTVTSSDNANQILNAFVHRQKTRDNNVAQDAQRLVNQFRQLSVFKPEFVVEYNQQLLNSGDDIRMMMKDILGGPTVRQYFDYLQMHITENENAEENTDADVYTSSNVNTGYLPSPDEDMPVYLNQNNQHIHATEPMIEMHQSNTLAETLAVLQENNRKQLEALTTTLVTLKDQFKQIEPQKKNIAQNYLTVDDLMQFQANQQQAFEQLIQMQNKALSTLAQQFMRTLHAESGSISTVETKETTSSVDTFSDTDSYIKPDEEMPVFTMPVEKPAENTYDKIVEDYDNDFVNEATDTDFSDYTETQDDIYSANSDVEILDTDDNNTVNAPTADELPELPDLPETTPADELPELPDLPETTTTDELPELPDLPDTTPADELPELPDLPETITADELPELPDLPDTTSADELPAPSTHQQSNVSPTPIATHTTPLPMRSMPSMAKSPAMPPIGLKKPPMPFARMPMKAIQTPPIPQQQKKEVPQQQSVKSETSNNDIEILSDIEL